MTIAKRISLLISIAVIALLLLGGGAIYGLKQLDSKLEDINSNIMPSVVLLNEITENVFLIRLRLQSHVMSDDMDKQKGLEKDIAELHGKVMEQLDQYEKEMVESARDGELLKEDRDAIAAFNAIRDKALEMSRNLMKTDAQFFLLENTTVSGNATQALRNHVQYNVEL